MRYSMFAVDEAPFCVWEWDLRERNLEFINNIDPTYFEYLAKNHLPGLETDAQKQHAALSLRTEYAHGLETFFALLFATVQAPDCVIGWLHKYELGDLRNLIQKVQRGDPILSKLRIQPITWQTIAYTVLTYLSLEDREQEKRIKDHFAAAWRHFAYDFSDEISNREYNSIKHGFRIRAGGFKVAIGKGEIWGISAPPERMQGLGGSDFGSSFFIPEKIGNNKLHFRLRKHSRNWMPESFFYGLHLISFSLQNILSFLKVMHGGDPTTVQFFWPNDESLFEAAWSLAPGVTGMNFDTMIAAQHITPFSKEEIMATYQTGDEPDPPAQAS